MPAWEQSTSRVFEDNREHAAKRSLGVIPTYRGVVPQSIVSLHTLGRGRAAEARLVQIVLAEGGPMLGVEKVFRPALVTRMIYRLAFQAPFAYQCSVQAILACFYRRRVASAVVEATEADVRVAEPLYVRWDAEAEAFVLGSEFVRGRGIVPQPTDSHTMRRWLAAWVGHEDRYPQKPPEEIHELLELMTKLEHRFRDCGLEGTGWQVCTRTMVSTANLLRTRDGYALVDLESGIPAVLLPSYVLRAARLGAVPPFDDLDADRLRGWVESHRSRLLSQLGRGRYELLCGDVERLIEHTEAWKQSEPALGRNKWRVFGVACRERFKARCLDTWRRRGLIDEQTETAIRPGRRIFTRMTFLLGLVRGAAGRCLQRLWANRSYRSIVWRFFSDAPFRRTQVKTLVAQYAERWSAAERIARNRKFSGVSLPFVLNCILATITPSRLHRWCSDPVYRRNMRLRMLLLCVSARFQSEYGRYLIRTCIRGWEETGRLTPREAMSLRQQLESSEMDEYVRCFGMHMGLKLLLPLLAPLKLGAGAALLVSGNLWFLFLLFLMPACRTAITLWRMLLRKRPAVDYADALLVGMLPTVGSLAYPIQMYSRYRELSVFLLRDSAARLGRWVPIFGGKDSRIEIGAIKLVNLVAECLEIGLAVTAPLRRRLAPSPWRAKAEPRAIDTAAGRWYRVANEQMRLIVESESAALPAGKFVEVAEPDRVSHAA